MKENTNEEEECGISIDGTWQKRVHASHNGVVTVISLDSKKSLDAEILCDKSQQCQKWQAKTNDPKHHEWKASHNCKVNHTGSANSMETVGALRIFERPLATKGLKYKDMLGDGDSAIYNTIVENKPYGEDCIPNKLEYISHVQKRVGSRVAEGKECQQRTEAGRGKRFGWKRYTDRQQNRCPSELLWISYSRKSGRCH